MHRVFVSSTVQDLRRHRKAVFDSIDQLGATVVAMEKFGARDERPKEECLRIIREETDVFVGIYAHRYGFIPKGDVLSITQLEYEQAIRAKVPTFVYLVDPSHRWPLAHIDTGGSADKLSEFVERLQDDRICSQFTTPNYLAAEVAADLGRYFSGDPRKALVRHGLIHRPRRAWVSGARRSRQQFKVVVFDLDGTLLRGNGFEFSWERSGTRSGSRPRPRASSSVTTAGELATAAHQRSGLPRTRTGATKPARCSGLEASPASSSKRWPSLCS